MAASNSAGKAAADQESATNIKETLESILVAFILAFIFRAFVVEAFVIPTGSMGPTLLGAHTHWRCPDCGYEWDANFSAPTNPNDRDDVMVPAVASGTTFNVRCPNCGYRIPPSEAMDPPVYYGDRILVLKYQYIYQEPNRWDVVVFKAPNNQGTRETQIYSENYIKRLVGLPNDKLMVLDGDVYVERPGQADFQILTKPRAAQEALWREVCNVDYQPRKLTRGADHPWVQPWEAASGSGWNTSSNVFSFDGTGAGALKFDPDADPDTNALTDLVGYDQTKMQEGTGDFSAMDEKLNSLIRFNVSDVKLDLFYERSSGDGPLRLRLTKYDQAFTAVISGNTVRLEKASANGGAAKEIARAAIADAGDKPLHIEFSNADYRVIVRVNDHDLITTTKADYAPDMNRLLSNYAAMRREYNLQSRNFTPPPELNPRPSISIEAENQVCAIHHLRLLRDVYYTPILQDAYGNLSWALHAMPDQDSAYPYVQLGPDDYFVMGDNSPMSFDARFWTDTVDLRRDEDLYSIPGRVPRRFMIGRAFFVYWPAGFRPLGDGMPGFVPDFGDMRIIH